MTQALPKTMLQLRSLVRANGELELSLAEISMPEPGPSEVLVRVEATPINPSDLGLLLGPADLATAKQSGSGTRPVVTATIPPALLRNLTARIDQSLPVGNEGAGVVVKAGSSPEAQALLGKTVAMLGGDMYAEYRCLDAGQCMALPGGITPREGASCYVNPLTALAMTETMRLEGHSALVHTAAASNLGQMLNKICIKDEIPLVNVVRRPDQEALLREIGAKHVVDQSSPKFMEELVKALSATGATLGFDAVGGGDLAGKILIAMEVAQSQKATQYSRYGSSVHKQVYIYGRLDTSPTILPSSVGMAWGAGGFLLTPFLQKVGHDGRKRMRERVVAELRTTFASHYTREISLAEALDLEVLRSYSRRATGEKYLIKPS